MGKIEDLLDLKCSRRKDLKPWELLNVNEFQVKREAKQK